MKKVICLFLSLIMIACSFPIMSVYAITEHHHSFSAWYVEDKATCFSGGTQYRKCYLCGEYEYRTTPKNPNVHDFGGYTYKIEATCTTDGREYRTCFYCGYKKTIKFVSRLGHDFSSYYIKNKNIKVYQCSRCSETMNVKTTLNEKAEYVLTKKAKSQKELFGEYYQYALVDLDNDNIVELISYPGYGYCSQIIFKYKKGKAKKFAVVGHSTFDKYYKKTNTIRLNGGNMGEFYNIYFKWKGSKLKGVASRYTYVSSKKVDYYIGKKKVSKKKYKSFVKKLSKGKAQNLDKLKWTSEFENIE